jgi:pimeloyl-ACP methyl ester carboxylesterase
MWVQKKFGALEQIYGIEEFSSGMDEILVVTFAGLGQSMSEKNYLFSNLRKKFAEFGLWFVQFDYRGHGDSAGELGEASLSTMVSDALVVLEDVTRDRKPKCIYLVGNALGAIISMHTALHFREITKIHCNPLLISPPLAKIPKSFDIIPAETLNQLREDKAIDSKLLFPGSDYYTLSNFDLQQYDYCQRLGGHMLYLHGQRLSWDLISEIDQIDLHKLIQSYGERIHAIFGEQDHENLLDCETSNLVVTSTLPGVRYFFQYPAAMDVLIETICSIVNERN